MKLVRATDDKDVKAPNLNRPIGDSRALFNATEIVSAIFGVLQDLVVIRNALKRWSEKTRNMNILNTRRRNYTRTKLQLALQTVCRYY
jgi:hypothetical protein